MRSSIGLVRFVTLPCAVADWPSFRGAEHDGVSAESSRLGDGAWPPDVYTELAVRKDVGAAQCWPHVVLSDGHILCRDRMGNLLSFVPKG